MTQPVHRGAKTATQSLAWFRQHGISGRLIPTRHRGQELREYECLTEYLDDVVRPATHRILAPHADHVIGGEL